MELLKLFDRPICFHRIFVEVTGSVTGALLLSQAVYWQRKSKSEDGWWWKTQEDWEEETGLTRRELESAKVACSCVMEFARKGVPCRTFYRINSDAFNVALTKASSLAESAKLKRRKQPNKPGGKRQTTNKGKEITEESDAIASPPSLSKRFVGLWESAYVEHFGHPYRFDGAKDGTAAAVLAKGARSPEDLISIAKRAWALAETNPYPFDSAVSIAGFNSRFNAIVGKLELLTRRPNPPGTRPPSRNAGTANEGLEGQYDGIGKV